MEEERVLGKINNVEISLKGKCVTKMTLQVTDATLYIIQYHIRERLAYTDLRTIKHRRRKTLVTDIPGDEVIRHFLSIYKETKKKSKKAKHKIKNQ